MADKKISELTALTAANADATDLLVIVDSTASETKKMTVAEAQLLFADGAMVYPSAGIAVSTGTAWGTSKTTPSGDVVGTTDTQTLTNKTLTSPRIGTAILDTNGNEVFAITATASAVNEFTIINGATGNNPQIQASGGDTNIGINLVPKGTGAVQAGGVPVVTTTGTQTLTNKTLTTPIISSISNTGTLTLPTSTDTLVGRATTDTLTNKTLTSPRVGTAILDSNGNEVFAITATASAVNEFTIVNAATTGTPQIQATGGDTNISINLVPKGTGTVQAGGVAVVTTTGTQTLTNKTLTSPRIGTAILDTNGNEVALITATASAVNEITLVNAATGNAVQIQATGGDANVSLNLVPKGSGSIQVGGVPVVTTTGTQTLTNKTLTSPVISSIVNTGTLTLPTSTDTLVGRATTDTLTNKTVNLTNNTLSGTKAQFDTACSDGNFVYTDAIGVSVQAYDAQLADVAGLTPTDNGVIIGNGTNFVVETGATLRTSLGLAIGTDVQAYDADTAKLDVAQSWTAQQTFKELKDTVHTITDGVAFEIDPANGSIQTVTLGANRTPAATNFEAGQIVLLGIDTGNADPTHYAITWTTVNPTWVKAGGSATQPTLASTGFTWLLLWKVGSTIYGTEVGKP